MVGKIKAPEDIKPNCQVIVDSSDPTWETRWFNPETTWVYAYHQGYLWPQRKIHQYYKFRELKELGNDI